MDQQVTSLVVASRAVAANPLGSALMSALVLFVVLAGGAWLAWQARSVKWAAGLGSGAVLPAMSLLQQVSWGLVLPLLAAVVVAVLVGRWWWARSETVVTRWGNRARRKSGVASSVDIARKASPRAMRARAAVVRPSLGELSRRELHRTATSEYAVMLCRVGRQWVWSSIEGVTLVIGIPRKGKSAMLAGTVLNAPGAVVATSTKLDLLRATRALRGRRGPGFVFNPGGQGGAEAASTVTFDPRTGCADPVAAGERAEDMIAAGSSSAGGDREYWDSQARRVLAALLHAAALGERPMSEVQKWAADPDEAGVELMDLLRRSPEPGFVADVRQFLSTNDRTRTSITSSIMPALAWLTHPAAAASANAGRDGRFGALPVLDVAELLATRGTIYLVSGEQGHVAPLVCALTGYIAREARRLAALSPDERLDPHLSMVLDEAAQICPVPLDRWSADMGGRGVCIVAGLQSRAQLIARYGAARAAVILNNAGAKVLFGGTSDRDDLQWWVTLAGERDELVATIGPDGRTSARSLRKVPVVSAAQLSQMPKHQVLVFTDGMPPVIGWGERYWRRPDVRALSHPDALDVRLRAARATATAAVQARAAAVGGLVWALVWRRPAGAVRAWWLPRMAAWRARRADPMEIGDPLSVGQVVPGQVVHSEVVTGEPVDTDARGPDRPIPGTATPEPAGPAVEGAAVIRFPGPGARTGGRPSPRPRISTAKGERDVWAGPDPRWWTNR